MWEGWAWILELDGLVHLLSPQLPATPLWVGHVTSLTRSSVSEEMGKTCEELGLMVSRILDATLVFLCVAPQQLCWGGLPARICR